jgi:hypothetical protein
MKYILLFLILSLFSCEHQKVTVGKAPAMNYTNVDVRKWHNEYLSIDSILIDGVLPLVTKMPVLLAHLGQPDTIVPVNIPVNTNLSLFDKVVGVPDKYLIFGSTIFESRGENVIINTFSVEGSDRKIMIPGAILDKNTSPLDLQKLFPESGQLIIGNASNTYSGYMMVCEGPPNSIHKMWVFVFYSGCLTKLMLVNYSPIQ